MSKYIFAMGSHASPTPQPIPHGVWTNVLWGDVPSNTTKSVLVEDKINWLIHPDDCGLWSVDVGVLWENTGGLPYHIREIRLICAFDDSIWPYVVKTNEKDYNPLRGHPEIGSRLSVYSQPGFDPQYTGHRFWVQVRQFSGQTTNIIPQDIQAPLLMGFRESGW